MSLHILSRSIACVLLFSCLTGISPPEHTRQAARAQGFYFESWRGGWGGPTGISIGIGVPPSGPLFYGMRPPQIFPPLGFPDVYRPVVPFGYRDYRAEYYDRLHQQYSLQLDADNRYRVDPLHQSNINNYLRGLSVPPLDGAPPVVQIQPYSNPLGRVDEAEVPELHHAPGADPAVRLQEAAERLTQALARRGEQGEIWLDYLAPETILQAIDEHSDPRELGEILLRYEGVLANGDLRWLWRTDGFMETRQWLRHYIHSANENGDDQQQPSVKNRPEVETDEAERPEIHKRPVPPPPPMPPQASSSVPAAAAVDAAPVHGPQVPQRSRGVSL